MVHKAKLLTVRFAMILTENFALYFGDLGHNDIDIFYNRILSVMYRSVYSNETVDIVHNATVPNYTVVDPFVKENVPRFLRHDTETPVLEERLAYAFHKTSITILGMLTMMVRMALSDFLHLCSGSQALKRATQSCQEVLL